MSSSDIEKGELDDKDANVSKIEPVNSFTRDNIGKNLITFTSPTGRVISVTGDVDEAMKIAIDIDDITYNKTQDKKLFRKINLYLLPLICILYSCQFMDKVSTSYAAVMGFRDAFNMVGDMYSWCGTAFYLGKEEQMFITSIWFSFNGLGTIMGGAIAYGLASRSESYSIASWKILFIVTGLMTLFVGVCFLFHVPDDPQRLGS
ncbi:hypothetical protein HII13_001641 [Brettanomyces bruxellensis]|nr:hypothetical protein HII13_001641 [Brettanomyces bruxellensis]